MILKPFSIEYLNSPWVFFHPKAPSTLEEMLHVMDICRDFVTSAETALLLCLGYFWLLLLFQSQSLSSEIVETWITWNMIIFCFGSYYPHRQKIASSPNEHWGPELLWMFVHSKNQFLQRFCSMNVWKKHHRFTSFTNECLPLIPSFIIPQNEFKIKRQEKKKRHWFAFWRSPQYHDFLSLRLF